MSVLYSAAAALVFPSLYEGGGIPVMEAMACGCPVAASDIPTTREFGGEAALLFDPTDTSSIVEAMHRLAQDESDRERRRLSGLKVARESSAAKIAEKLVGIYARCKRPDIG